MRVLEFSEEEVEAMIEVLSGLLHCGNVQFEAIEDAHAG